MFETEYSQILSKRENNFSYLSLKNEAITNLTLK